MREVLKDQYTEQSFIVRQRSYKRCSDEKIFYGDEQDFYEEDEYLTSATRYFKIVGITENEFLEKVKEINDSRFD